MIFSRRMKDPAPIHDDELSRVLASLETWKQNLPRYERCAGRDTPALTPDRLLKGYYMVSPWGEDGTQSAEILDQHRPTLLQP